MQGYWATQRLKRRTFLKATAMGGVSATAASILACSSKGGTSNQGSTPSSGGSPAAGQPKRGGTLVASVTADSPTIDPHKTITTLTFQQVSAFYSRLVRFKSGPGLDSFKFELEPDLAASWEGTKDLLTWTFKLQPNAKWHNKSPVNGRKVTSEDVKATFDRYFAQPAGNNKALLSMLDKWETPDDSTVVFRMKVPYALWPSTLASGWFIWVLPKEVGSGQIDPAQPDQVVGSGPFMLKEWARGSRFVNEANPDFYLGRPNVDGFQSLIISDTGNSLAQFRAGNLHLRGIDAVELQDVKSSIPGVQILDYLPISQNVIYFSGHSQPDALKDVRVRRALSLALDRDGLLKVLSGGLGSWNTAVPAAFSKFWLNPKNPSTFGKGAEWQKFDVTAAKQQLSAAGLANGFEIDYHVANYGAVQVQRAQATAEMFNAIGVKTKISVDDVAGVFLQKTILGDFNGVNDAPVTPFEEVDHNLFAVLHSSSPRVSPLIYNKDVDALVLKQRTTADQSERVSAIQEIQRIVADQAYYLFHPAGQAHAGSLPKVKNYFVVGQGIAAPAESYSKLWLEG